MSSIKPSVVLDAYLKELGGLTDSQYHFIKVAMDDYAKQKCKEQKRLCINAIPEPFFQKKILEAKEPEFEYVD